MTNDEFQNWWRSHTATFPDVATWLAKFPENPKADMPSRTQILQQWRDQLRDVSLADALAATERLSREPDEKQPKSAAKHPGWIWRHCAQRSRTTQHQRRPVVVDGQEAYHCLQCRDMGRVIVWQERTMRAVELGIPLDGRTMTTCGVRCTCEAGHEFRWMEDEFDPKTMLPCMGGKTVDEWRAAIEEFATNRKPAAYHDEFDAWSGKR